MNSSAAPPFGWSATRHNTHLRSVFPTSSAGAYRNIHRNIPSVIKPPYPNVERQAPDERRILNLLAKYKPHEPTFQNLHHLSYSQLQDLVTRLHLQPRRGRLDLQDSGESKKGNQETFNRLAKAKSSPTLPEIKRSGKSMNEGELLKLIERLGKPTGRLKDPHPPPDSPKVPKGVDVQALTDRLCSYDNQRWPPNSNYGRKLLPFDRYEDQSRVHFEEVPTKKVSVMELEDIIGRLAVEHIRKYKDTDLNEDSAGESGPKLNSSDVQAIFERLQKVDFTKCPPGSTASRHMLGYGRYDYGEGRFQKAKTARVEKEVMEEIIGRLIKYDITKYPPESRGHETKRAAN